MHVVCTFSFCNNNLYEISSICTLNFNPYFLYKSHYSNFSSFVFAIKMYVSVNLCVFHYLCMNSLLYIIDHPLLPAHLSITPLYSCLCIINICIKYFLDEDPNPENLKDLNKYLRITNRHTPKMMITKYRRFKNRHTCEKAYEVSRILNCRYLQ